MKLKVLSAGAIFFMGGVVSAQKTKSDSIKERKIDEVVVVGMSIKRDAKALGYQVTTIDKEAFESKAASDVSTLLTGKTPGLNIVSSGGQAGSSSTISIRNQKSFSGSSQPLFVIDGVPMISDSNDQGNFATGTNNTTSRFQDIDPNSIEDMKVLSGLAATNIYGSLGRNGVILITTKGKNNKGRFSVDLINTTYITQINNLPGFQNKYGQGGDFVNNNAFLGNWGAAFDPTILVNHHYNTSTLASIYPQYQGLKVPYQAVPDNVKNYFKNGFGTSNNLRVSGGGETFNYSTSVGYNNEDGIIPENNFNRLTFGVSGNVKLFDKLTVNGDINYIKSSFKSPPIAGAGGSGMSIFELLMYIPRNLDLMNNPYQNPGTGANVYYRPDFDNPLWMTYNAGDRQNVNRVMSKFGLDYKFSQKFSGTYRVGYDVVDDHQRFFVNKGSIDSNYSTGMLRDVFGKQTLLDQTLIFNLAKTNIVGKLNFDGYIGGQSRVDEYGQTGLESQNQLQFGRLEHNFFESQSSNSRFIGDLDYKYRSNLFGVFAGVTADYNNMVFLTLSARNDWSSSVEKANNSLLYPSASLAFDMKKILGITGKTVNFLKLRAGYGTSANFPSLYLTRNFFGFNPRAFMTGQISYPTNFASSTKGNPDLKPELYKENEFGIESKFFNNRVGLNASYYNRTTTDQIFQRELDPSTGFTQTFINAGKITGEGLEILLDVNPIRSQFNWDFTLNFNKMVSRVKEMPEGSSKIAYAGFSNLGLYAVEGQKLGEIYGTYALKDNQGRYLINPANGKIITSSDVGLPAGRIGNNQADYTLTLMNNFSYKGLTLSAQIDFVKGGDVYSSTAANLIMRGVTKDTENREGTFVLPGIYANPSSGVVYNDSSGNPINNTVALPLQYIYFLNLRNADSEWVYDATRLRLREVSLSYALPKKLLANTFMNSLSMSLNGNNLWFRAFNAPKYVKFDPDNSVTRAQGGGLDFQTAPSSRRIGFSIKATF